MKTSAYKSERITEKQLHGMIMETVCRVLNEVSPGIPLKKQKFTVCIYVLDKNGEIIDDFKEWCHASSEREAVQKIKEEYWMQFQSGRYRICHVEPY